MNRPKFTRIQSGKIVARAVWRAWRASPPPLDVSEDSLGEVRSGILKSESAGLVWWAQAVNG